MTATAIRFWSLVKKQCSEQPSLCFNSASKKDFLEDCERAYKAYKTRYMKPNVEHLDRHKIGAILICQGLKHHLISATGNIENQCEARGEIFIGEEKILIFCVLHYITQQVNKILDTTEARKNGIGPLLQFRLPSALSCKTEWLDIMSRTLYYNKCDDKISQLSIAEELFLLEQIAIREYYKDKSGEVLAYLKEITCK